MRLTRLVAGSVLLVISFVSAQWPETKIYLPIRSVGLRHLRAFGHGLHMTARVAPY